MTDGQTDLMQQVVERPDSTLASLLGLPPDSFTVDEPRRPCPAPERIPTAALTGLPRGSVQHVARLAIKPIDHPAILDLVAHLLRGQPEPLHAHLDELVARGLPVEHIYLRLFQPAARHLDMLWAEDRCSFVDVTIGMTLLQSGLRHLSPRFQRHGRSADGTRTVLLAALGKDQHTLDLSMTAEFFCRGGWSVQCFFGEDADDLDHALGRETRAVVGLSASRTCHVPEMAAAIRRLRRNGRNHLAGIFVTGPLFLTRSDCGGDIAADGVALDPRQALAQAETLLFGVEGCR